MSKTVSKTRSEDDRPANVYDDPFVVEATRRRDEIRHRLSLACDGETVASPSVREIETAAVAVLDDQPAPRQAREVRHEREVLERALRMADQRVLQAIVTAGVPIVEQARQPHAEKLAAVFAATVSLQQALLDEEAFISRMTAAGVSNAPMHFVRPGAFLPAVTIRLLRLLDLAEAKSRLAKHGVEL
jgi:hypothetical protein